MLKFIAFRKYSLKSIVNELIQDDLHGLLRVILMISIHFDCKFCNAFVIVVFVIVKGGQ